MSPPQGRTLRGVAGAWKKCRAWFRCARFLPSCSFADIFGVQICGIHLSSEKFRRIVLNPNRPHFLCVSGAYFPDVFPRNSCRFFADFLLADFFLSVMLRSGSFPVGFPRYIFVVPVFLFRRSFCFPLLFWFSSADFLAIFVLFSVVFLLFACRWLRPSFLCVDFLPVFRWFVSLLRSSCWFFFSVFFDVSRLFPGLLRMFSSLLSSVFLLIFILWQVGSVLLAFCRFSASYLRVWLCSVWGFPGCFLSVNFLALLPLVICFCWFSGLFLAVLCISFPVGFRVFFSLSRFSLLFLFFWFSSADFLSVFNCFGGIFLLVFGRMFLPVRLSCLFLVSFVSRG